MKALKRSPAVKDRVIREEPEKLLVEGAEKLGLSLSAHQITSLLVYLSELIRWNQKVNLTGLRQEREIVVKHFLDSLTPLAFLNSREDLNWIDVGTGAGFPGLVLKIARPELQMTLVEAAEKKATFLHHLIGSLRLTGVSVVQERLEQLIGIRWKGAFDLLATRALDPLLVLDKGKTLVRAGGKMLFFQARPDREKWERQLKNHPGVVLDRIEPVVLPFSSSPRTLIVLKVA
jgi:16S rRNA (guanine527-N7)-methyltransferase